MAVIIENPETVDSAGTAASQNPYEQRLVGWIMRKVTAWRDYRNSYIANDRWIQYWRIWKGEWSPELSNRSKERSRLIAPATQQAIDSGVAEIEEAAFGQGRFFDVDVPAGSQPDKTMEAMRDNLFEDMKLADIRGEASKAFLSGGIFGTCIGKISVSEENVFENLIANPTKGAQKRIVVRLTAVHPAEFVIDPSARTIDDALGMAHMIEVPKNTVLKKMSDGTYFKRSLGNAPARDTERNLLLPLGANLENVQDATFIVEYHGLVPRVLLEGVQPAKEPAEGDEVVNLFPDKESSEFEGLKSEPEPDDYDDLVEAVVTIANNAVLLRADENKLFMQDRAFIAAPYEVVLGQFWGRGIAEKAFNAQKALDSELRGRIDAMAYSIHPLVAMDATKLPPNTKFEVYAGKNLLTIGDPSQAIKFFNMTGPGIESFSQSGDLERMVQMATGTPDSSAGMGNPKNSTLGGMSMIQAGVLKRTKRVMSNIERNFMEPLVRKIAWRYIQFDPVRYPPTDGKFRVFTTLGIMAREVEQQQLSTMLNTSQPNSPAYFMLLRGIYQNSSISNKEDMIALVDKLLQQAMQPSPEQQLQMQQLQVNIRDKLLQRSLEQQRIQVERLRAMAEVHRSGSQIALNEANAILSLAQAESQKVNTVIDGLVTLMESLETRAESGAQYDAGGIGAQAQPLSGPVSAPGLEGTNG